jgi:uncharacterized protein (TIGR00369 family)
VEYTADALARLNDNPLYGNLGIRVLEARDGRVRATLAPTVHACWPLKDQPHGGVLFTVIDTSMAFAAMTAGEPGSDCATVDCSIQYPAPARHGPYACEAVVIQRSARTVFVRAEIVDARGAIVALGQGTFRLIVAKGA